MSITQSYYLAHKARSKLSREAARPDHNLRLLVGHANLLDSLMLDLAEAEREQESWFNQSVRGATEKKESQHIQWDDSIIEEPEEDWEAEDVSSDDSDSYSDSDSESSEEDCDVEMADAIPLRRVASHSSNYIHYNNTPSKPMPLDSMDLDQTEAHEEAVEFEDDYEDEDYAQLTLTRSPSHSHSPPPELDEDNDSSEDESMPPSPPNPPMHELSEKQREALVTTSYYESKPIEEDRSSFYEQGYYLPRRASPPSLISPISVY